MATTTSLDDWNHLVQEIATTLDPKVGVVEHALTFIHSQPHSHSFTHSQARLRRYWQAHTRPDGRLASQCRPTKLQTGILSSSSGSALVNDNVFVGVFYQVGVGGGEVVVVGDDDDEWYLTRLLNLAVDWNATGRLSHSMGWRLFVTVEGDGASRDDLLLASVAALGTTRLPSHVEYEDGKMWIMKADVTKPVVLRTVPVPLTIGLWVDEQGQTQWLVDPSVEEQAGLTGTLSIVLDARQPDQVLSMELSGGTFRKADLARALLLAKGRAEELRAILEPSG